jgi:hypothetical protein
MLALLSLSAFGQEIVIGWTGGSVAVGTAPALTGNVIPASVTYYINGTLQTTLPFPNTAGQDGYFDCMDSWGYDLVVFQRAQPNITANYLMDNYVPNLILDAQGHGKNIDALVLFHGSNDAKSVTFTGLYDHRVFGPWFVLGPGSLDKSIAGQIRTAFGYDTPIIPVTASNFNGLDLLLGVPENDDHYWHAEVRARTLYGCALDQFCWPVVTGPGQIPTAADDHPTSEGYYDWGWMACHQTINALYGL